MKFLANENFPLKSILYLRQQGIDIIAIGTDHKGIKDHDVMALAMSEGRTILTFDRDYGELIFRFNYRPEKGVIFLRLDEYSPDLPGKIVEALTKNNEHEFDNALTVVDENGIRQRKY